jgi:hypothetical protein
MLKRIFDLATGSLSTGNNAGTGSQENDRAANKNVQRAFGLATSPVRPGQKECALVWQPLRDTTRPRSYPDSPDTTYSSGTNGHLPPGSACIMACECPHACSLEPEKRLRAPEMVIDSSGRPTTVVGRGLSGKSRLK